MPNLAKGRLAQLQCQLTGATAYQCPDRYSATSLHCCAPPPPPPQGLAKAQPGGMLQHTANAAFLVLSAVDAEVFPAAKFMRHACWVRNQIGYMLVSGPA